MKMLNKICVGCLTVLLAWPVTAREKWSLSRCIGYAIENNIEIRQRMLDRDQQEIALHTSRMSRLPDLNASLGQDFYFGRGPSRDGTYTDQSQASSSFRVGTNIPVFTGLRIPNEIAARKLDLKAAIEDLNRAKEDVALRVTSFYLQVLYNKELVRIGQEQISISQAQVEKTAVLVEAGKNPESALYESKATLARDELTLTQYENELTLVILDLTQLLNLKDPELFDVETFSEEQLSAVEGSLLITPTEVFNWSVQHRPAIKSARYLLESSKKNLKVMQSGYYPTLSFGASYNTAYYHTYQDGAVNNPFGEQLRNNGSELIGLSLSIPIFNRLATRNQVRQARVNIFRQQLVLENQYQDLFKEIEQAYYNAVAARKKYASSGKAVEASRIAFRYEEQKYDAGKSTAFEFNDAKSRYEKTLAEEAQSLYEFILRTKILDFYYGKPLTQ